MALDVRDVHGQRRRFWISALGARHVGGEFDLPDRTSVASGDGSDLEPSGVAPS